MDTSSQPMGGTAPLALRVAGAGLGLSGIGLLIASVIFPTDTGANSYRELTSSVLNNSRWQVANWFFLVSMLLVSVTVWALIDSGYLKQRSALIDPKKDMGTATAGTPPDKRADYAPQRSQQLPGTSHLSAVDDRVGRNPQGIRPVIEPVGGLRMQPLSGNAAVVVGEHAGIGLQNSQRRCEVRHLLQLDTIRLFSSPKRCDLPPAGPPATSDCWSIG